MAISLPRRGTTGTPPADERKNIQAPVNTTSVAGKLEKDLALTPESTAMSAPNKSALAASPTSNSNPSQVTALAKPAGQEESSKGPISGVGQHRRAYGTAQEEMFNILRRSAKYDASDIILTVGLPPMFRAAGSFVKDNFPVLTVDIVKKLVYSFLRQEQIAEYEGEYELDLSLSVPGVARYRVNVFRQKKCVAAAFRTISEKIPTFEELQLPKPIEHLALSPRGLVLVTGPTGSGKSSTLAAMVNLINHRRNCHIITIEDPIEFVHKHINCIVEQREIKSDTHSFSKALRQSLRQDPDIILVGEMRDLETIQSAIRAAETGHLVFSTLHTQDSAQTVDRIIDVFPSHQQAQIRTQLSTSLVGVVSQQLLPSQKGGRVCAREIMLVNTAISHLIREGKTFSINSAIQTGAKQGMCTMDSSLSELYQKGLITHDDALSKAIEPDSIKVQF